MRNRLRESKPLAALLLAGAATVANATTQCNTVGPANNCGPENPAWLRWCDKYETPYNIPCNEATYNAKMGWVAPGTLGATPVPAHTDQPWGQTPAQITAAFPAKIAANFANNANLNAQLTNIEPVISRLSTELLALDHSGYTAQILKSAAEKASAANLRLLQSAFGPTLLAQALPYAPAAIQAQYNALPVAAALPISAYYYTSHGQVSPFTNSESYLVDVLLEIYTSGSDSGNVALHKTQMYAQAVTGAGQLQVLYSPTLPPAPSVLHADGFGGFHPDGAGQTIMGWVGFILTVVSFIDPNAAADLLSAYNNLPQGGYIVGSPLLWAPSPFTTGAPSDYPPSFPSDPGDENAQDPCSVDPDDYGVCAPAPD